MIHIANPIIEEEAKEAVMGVMESGMLAQGEEVSAFEEEFSDYIGVNYAKAVANGTAALDVALKSLEIGEGDEVITTPFSFIASSNCVLFQNARPVFGDIKQDTFNLDPDSVKERINKNTKAILPVHLFGQPADMVAIGEIAEDYGLYLIEDCAQAHGAELNGRKVGSLGDIGTYSFYPTKNMTTGEGGMIVTDDEELAERGSLLRDHGQGEKYSHQEVGYNFRMTDINGAMGRIQLKNLDKRNQKRIENADLMTERIKKIRGLTPPKVRKNAKHVFHQYVIRVESEYPLNRDELAENLDDEGIGTAVHYPEPIVEQPVYRDKGYSSDCCPVAKKAAGRVLSLPVHPSVEEENIDFICDRLEKGVGRDD